MTLLFLHVPSLGTEAACVLDLGGGRRRGEHLVFLVHRCLEREVDHTHTISLT